MIKGIIMRLTAMTVYRMFRKGAIERPATHTTKLCPQCDTVVSTKKTVGGRCVSCFREEMSKEPGERTKVTIKKEVKQAIPVEVMHD